MSTAIPHSRPCICDDEFREIEKVLKSRMLVGGSLHGRFTSALCELSPSIAHASVFSSGRAALLAALRAANLPLDSGVIVQSYVCDAVLWAIHQAGCRPVLCDIGDGWTSDISHVERTLDSSCKALILAPPFGLLQSARPFRVFGIPIIHDLCQASPRILTQFDTADFGDLVVLSFHPTKYMCAVTGGAVLDLNGAYAKKLFTLHSETDSVAPFSDLQAALGLGQLDRLFIFKRRRQEIARRYLATVDGQHSAKLARARDVDLGDLYRLPLDLPEVDLLPMFDAFGREGIMARRGVDQLAHRLLGRPDCDFPNSVRAFNRTFSLPYHPSLTDEEVETVAGTAGRLLC